MKFKVGDNIKLWNPKWGPKESSTYEGIIESIDADCPEIPYLVLITKTAKDAGISPGWSFSYGEDVVLHPIFDPVDILKEML